MSNGTNTVSKSSRKESKTAYSTLHRSSAMSEHSPVKGTPDDIEAWLASSPPASRVSPFPWRVEAMDTEAPMTATNGLKHYGSFMTLDRDSHCWRTSLDLSQAAKSRTGWSQVVISRQSWGSYPKSAMIVSGIAYLLQPWVLRTKEIASGFLRSTGPNTEGMWATPKAWDGEMGTPRTSGHPVERSTHLGTQVRLWPTPTVAEADKIPATANYGQKGLNNHPRIRGEPTRPKLKKDRAGVDGGKSTLQTWATPTARLGSARGPQAKRFSDPKRSNDLDDQVAVKVTGQLSSDWVEWLMGWPIEWTALKPLATGRFQQWLWLHGIDSTQNTAGLTRNNLVCYSDDTNRKERNVSVSKMIDAAYKIDAWISEKKAAHKAEIAEAETDLANLKSAIRDFLTENGLKNARSEESGKGFRLAEKTWTNITDWEQFFDWAMGQADPSAYFQKACKKTEVMNYIEETGEVIPGVEAGGEIGLNKMS